MSQLESSACGCVSDPRSKLFAPCARESHRGTPDGYRGAERRTCSDCGRELLYAHGMAPVDPCCARCCRLRYERDCAERLDAYYGRAAEELLTLARVRHEPMIEVIDLAFACTPLQDADGIIDPLSDPTAAERLHVMRRAARLQRETTR